MPERLSNFSYVIITIFNNLKIEISILNHKKDILV